MEFVQLLFYGLVLGSIFALGAIGVSLTFGILGFANFSDRKSTRLNSSHYS